MAALFARAGAAMIPGASQLPFVGGGGRDVPELTLRLTDVEVDRARVADYDRVCGFALRDVLPPTYPHMLAFPLQLSLMTDPSFPFPAIGLVHIANRITQHRPIRGSERLRSTCGRRPSRTTRAGKQFSLRYRGPRRRRARVGGGLDEPEARKSGRRPPVRRGASFRAADGPPRDRDVDAARATSAAATPSVSGDYNPIHMHPLSARLFGFPSAIAHGMWTKARCLAALEPRLPDAFTVDVAFKQPILLPGKVEFCEASGPEQNPGSASSSASATLAMAARTSTASSTPADSVEQPLADEPAASGARRAREDRASDVLGVLVQ